MILSNKQQAASSKQKSFTLMEILVYIGVFSIIMLIILSFVFWLIHSNSKLKVMRGTLDNAKRAMETMTSEIKEAGNIYTATSFFDSHPGQLSLETTKYLPTGEETTYIDFYLCNSRLCMKKESQNPIALTSDSVEISNLVFTQTGYGEASSLQINLTVDYKNPTGRPEYQATINLTSTASLRSY